MTYLNELRQLTQAVDGQGNCNQVWIEQREGVPTVLVGYIGEGGEVYPVVTIDPHYAEGQSLPLGKFYAAANPAVITEILGRLETTEKECDALRLEIRVARQECDHANQRYSSALRILTGIHAVLYPPSFTDYDGRTWQFKTPLVEEQLQELSDRIRTLLDEIARTAPEEVK